MFNRFLSSKISNFTKKVCNFSSSSSISSSTSFSGKLGILLGIGCLPFTGFFVYDRFSDLPEELKKLNFPFSARFYIRRALCPANSIQETARFLDLAMQKVLNSGIGSASPESTALVLYLSRLYLEAKDINLPDLEAAHYALTFKPHVGEAIKEELARLELSFKVADRLCSFYSSNAHVNSEKVQFYANKSIGLMENGPNYLVSKFENCPLKLKFQEYLNKLGQ